MGDKLPSTLVGLSWGELNNVLLECEDVPTLQRWLREMTRSASGRYRALRVHSRMNAVRRAQEVKAIQQTITRRNREDE